MPTDRMFIETLGAGREMRFPPLDCETREAVPTEVAAWHLTRRPQTLRAWAWTQSGPLQPVRIHGRLCWSVAEIRRLLQVDGEIT